MLGGIVREPRQHKGFTLIELLVVIAIIAILAAILFPVFAKAQDNAKLTRCMVHLGQIGKAIQQYTDDNDARYPIGPSKDTPTGALKGWWEGQGIGGKKTGTRNFVPPKERPLYKYTSGNLDIWKCPSEMKQGCGGQTPEFPCDAFGNSYTMNGMVGYSPTMSGVGPNYYTLQGDGAIGSGRPAPRKTSDVKHPTKIWMVGERTMHHYWYTQASPDNAPLGHMNDKPFSPVVYCDGHCGTIYSNPTLVDKDGRWGYMEKGWFPGKDAGAGI